MNVTEPVSDVGTIVLLPTSDQQLGAAVPPPDDVTDPADDLGVDREPQPLRTLRYVLGPTLYTDEHSSTEELLWQLTLELRAVRATLVVGLAVGLLVATIAVVLVAIIVATT